MKFPKLEMQDYIVLGALGGLAYLWYKKETAPGTISQTSSLPASPRTGTTTVTQPNPPAQPTSSSDGGDIGNTIFSNTSSALPGFGDDS